MTDPAQRWRTAALAAASLLPLTAARAQPTLEELIQRIEEQEQKILVLERKLEIKEEADKSAAGSAATVRADSRGFALRSADGQNQLRLRGVLHFDGRNLTNDDPNDVTDTWQATRIRPIVEGTVGGIYDFRFTPDFGQGRTVIQDAYVTGRFKPSLPGDRRQVQGAGGPRAPAVGERPPLRRARLPDRASRRTATSACRWAATLVDSRLNYAVAFLNGSNDGASSEAFSDVDINDDKEWAGRLFAHPFAESDTFALRGLGLGIAATYTDQDGTTAQPLLPTYRTPGQSTFFRYRTGATLDPRRRRAHPHRAAALLLRRVVRPAGRVHAGVAGRRAHDRGGPARGLARHDRVAARGIVVPDGRGSGVSRLQAELRLLAGQRHLGRVRDSSPATMS